MILAAVDDFLFRSKIRTVAKQAGVEIAFAKTPDDILAQARAQKPSLVIFDLNDPKADPINTVAAMKLDPELAGLRTMGFVSHVHTEVIGAARKAGVGEVLARSTFAGNLAEILRSADQA
jgi:DNA-binding NarL/FixJ family response regulator